MVGGGVQAKVRYVRVKERRVHGKEIPRPHGNDKWWFSLSSLKFKDLKWIRGKWGLLKMKYLVNYALILSKIDPTLVTWILDKGCDWCNLYPYPNLLRVRRGGSLTFGEILVKFYKVPKFCLLSFCSAFFHARIPGVKKLLTRYVRELLTNLRNELESVKLCSK